MLKRMTPAPDRTVPDANGKPIMGTIVVDTASTYYKRRIAAGDLVDFKKVKPPKEGK